MKPRPSENLSHKLLSATFDTIKERLITLLKEQACFEGDVILPSGRIASHYLDIKEALLSAEGGLLSSLAILHHLKEEVEFIGGSVSRAYSLVSAASQFAYIKGQEINAFVVRNGARERGYSKWIEGPLKVGGKVCIVQDLVVDGLKIIESIRMVQEEAKAEIVQAIGIVDRQDGARKRLQELGIDYTAICTMDEILS